jgi:hypothetical protein
MAATNVQAFSGDVEISSNLAVATNELFVDTVSGRVGIGTTNPSRALEIAAPAGNAILNLKRSDAGTGQGGIGFLNLNSNVCASITAARSGTEGGVLKFYTAPDDTTQTSDNPYLIPQRMCIDVDGNVGIGTTDPGQKLSIYTGSTTVPALSFDRYPSGNYRTDIHQNTYGADFRVGHDTYTPSSVLYLKRKSDGSKEVEIDGYVGIGTDNPAQILHVEKPSASTGNQIGLVLSDDQGGNSSTTLPAIGFSHNHGLIFRGGIQMVNESNNLEKAMIFRCGRSGSLGGFATHPLNSVPERMRINRNGYVGINDSSTSQMLDVNGNIRGNKVFSHTATPSIDGVYRNYYYINNTYTGWVRIMSRAAGQLNGWAVGEFGRQDGGISSFAYRMRGNGNFQITYSSAQLRLKKNPSSGMSIKFDVLSH